jgi:hypothetical protein
MSNFKPHIYDRDVALVLMKENGLKVKHLETWVRKLKVLYNNAPKRDAKCKLTLSQYLKLVIEAGLTVPSQIGKKSHQYNISRKGDTGDYTYKNCKCITHAQNMAERIKNGGNAAASEKMSGRTKENHSGIRAMAEKLRGRTKDTDPSVKSQSEKVSKAYRIVSPDGKVYKGINLTEFAKKHDLDYSCLKRVFSGVRPHHKGWTGKYIKRKKSS